MKLKLNKNKLILAAGVSITGLAILSCSKDFLERPPYGVLNSGELANRNGVEGLLVGAYSLLDGVGLDDWMVDVHHTTVWNTFLGSTGADDAHKGGGPGNDPGRAEVENKKLTSYNNVVHHKWKFLYAGVGRANETIRMLNRAKDQFSDAEATQILAEARALRAIYHFEAAKIWHNIPYVDENVTPNSENYKIPNTHDPNTWPEVWAKIEEDLQFAIQHLPATQAQVGRVNQWAAKAFLAKTYMQQAKLTEALPVLTDIINNGKSVKGENLDLVEKFADLFKTATENNEESVFAVQMSNKENMGAQGANGNEGQKFAVPNGITGGAGWAHLPSFNLVNAYRTQGGLPLLDNFNDVNVAHNLGLSPTDPFTPDPNPLDPRLDWTVARRGLPFHDWAIFNNAPGHGGPYASKKWVPYKTDPTHEVVDGWMTTSGINFPMIRFADILLMAAEAEIEVGDPNKALDYVNRVRARAANPQGFLKKYINDADPSQGFSTTDAATYEVNQYAAGSFNDKAFARKAIRFERRLELATEGHRFFDLQRFDRIDKKYGNATNYMATLLNAYYATEPGKFTAAIGEPYSILVGAIFVAGKHELYPIPQDEIEVSRIGSDQQATLKQNPGYE